jgi:hypothetical protein
MEPVGSWKERMDNCCKRMVIIEAIHDEGNTKLWGDVPFRKDLSENVKMLLK